MISLLTALLAASAPPLFDEPLDAPPTAMHQEGRTGTLYWSAGRTGRVFRLAEGSAVPEFVTEVGWPVIHMQAVEGRVVGAVMGGDCLFTFGADAPERRRWAPVPEGRECAALVSSGRAVWSVETKPVQDWIACPVAIGDEGISRGDPVRIHAISGGGSSFALSPRQELLYEASGSSLRAHVLVEGGWTHAVDQRDMQDASTLVAWPGGLGVAVGGSIYDAWMCDRIESIPGNQVAVHPDGGWALIAARRSTEAVLVATSDLSRRVAVPLVAPAREGSMWLQRGRAVLLSRDRIWAVSVPDGDGRSVPALPEPPSLVAYLGEEWTWSPGAPADSSGGPLTAAPDGRLTWTPSWEEVSRGPTRAHAELALSGGPPWRLAVGISARIARFPDPEDTSRTFDGFRLIEVGDDLVFLDGFTGIVRRLDGESLDVIWSRQIGGRGVDMALMRDEVWVSSAELHSLVILDASDGRVVRLVPTGDRAPMAMAATVGEALVAWSAENSRRPAFSRIDASGRIEEVEVTSSGVISTSPARMGVAGGDRMWTGPVYPHELWIVEAGRIRHERTMGYGTTEEPLPAGEAFLSGGMSVYWGDGFRRRQSFPQGTRSVHAHPDGEALIVLEQNNSGDQLELLVYARTTTSPSVRVSLGRFQWGTAEILHSRLYAAGPGYVISAPVPRGP